MADDETDKKKAEQQGQTSAEQDTVADGPRAHQSDSSEAREDDAMQAAIKEAVEAALEEQKDTVLRAQAEVQNMRRRCEQDVEKAHKFALEKFASELLAVVDNLERALQSVPDPEAEPVKALYEGLELTHKGFLETLARFNLEQIDPEGEPFDPQLHEAITMQPDDEVEPNTVLAVVQKGYTLNGRVIRPSRVVVSKPGAGVSG